MLFFLWQFFVLKTKILFPHDSWLYRIWCLEKNRCTKFIKVKNQLIAMWGDAQIYRHFSEEWRYVSSKASQSWLIYMKIIKLSLSAIIAVLVITIILIIWVLLHHNLYLTTSSSTSGNGAIIIRPPHLWPLARTSWILPGGEGKHCPKDCSQEKSETPHTLRPFSVL